MLSGIESSLVEERIWENQEISKSKFQPNQAGSHKVGPTGNPIPIPLLYLAIKINRFLHPPTTPPVHKQHWANFADKISKLENTTTIEIDQGLRKKKKKSFERKRERDQMAAITSALIAIAGVVLGWIAIEIACKPCLEQGREAIDRSLNPDYDPDDAVSATTTTNNNNIRAPLITSESDDPVVVGASSTTSYDSSVKPIWILTLTAPLFPWYLQYPSYFLSFFSCCLC